MISDLVFPVSDKFEASGITLRQYLDFCEDFEHHLAGHHGCGVLHLFPLSTDANPPASLQYRRASYLSYPGQEASRVQRRAPRGAQEDPRGFAFRRLAQLAAPESFLMFASPFPGVDLLTAYINKCKASPKEFSSGEFRKVHFPSRPLPRFRDR